MTSITDSNAVRITVEKFRQLLDEQHPFAAVLGIEVLEIGAGSALLRLPERDAHKRLGGTIAGPMLMGLADLALYAAIVGATGNTQAVTASLTINFLRRTPSGGVLAKAHILKTGRFTAGEVLLSPERGGEPVAQVISTWALPPRPVPSQAD